MSHDRIFEEVEGYYSERIRVHGATARGVDWNSAESQRLRFAQLAKILDRNLTFSINDYGCGYGALADYLRDEGFSFHYCGFDISMHMIEKARELHDAISQVTFISADQELSHADYTFASGVFNVKLQTPVAEWEEYALHTLDTINRISRRGFAFNVLTKYSDPEYMRSDLYYADPLFFFDYCKRNFTRFVSLLHDYPLYEFSILARKE